MCSKIKKRPEQKVSVSPIMLQCVSPLMALSCRADRLPPRQLLGIKQTSRSDGAVAAPKADIARLTRR